MKSFTDIFIRHPVLAAVVNLVIVLVGWRALTAIGGVDNVESTSRAGVSTVTVRLKLNHNSTQALAEVTARLQQVRSELPEEAEPPVVEVQRADRPYATFYIGFTSTERDV